MTQSHEPSYYEIALTNKQVLIVFVVLLVCIVAAFFSGVWIGRQDSLPAAVLAAAENTDSSTVEGEEANVGELHFFSDNEGEPEPSLAEIAEEPTPGTTLLEDLGAGEAAEEPPAESVQEQVQTAAPPPAISEPEPAPAAGGHVIQVFSSADEVQAKKLLKQLQDGGYPAFLSPVDVSGQTMFRVRIGPYSELTEAEVVADRIRQSFRLDTWVTR